MVNDWLKPPPLLVIAGLGPAIHAGIGMRSHWVYILASRPRGTLYVGMTNDLIRRIYRHREGLVDGFTKEHGVKLLVSFEQHATAMAASTREEHQTLVASVENRFYPLDESQLARSLGGHRTLTTRSFNATPQHGPPGQAWR